MSTTQNNCEDTAAVECSSYEEYNEEYEEEQDEFYKFCLKSEQQRLKELGKRIGEDSFIELIVDNLDDSNLDSVYWEFLLTKANENTIDYVIVGFLSCVKPEYKSDVFVALSNQSLSDVGLDTILDYAISRKKINNLLRTLPNVLKSSHAKKISDAVIQTEDFRYLGYEGLAEYKVLMFVLMQNEGQIDEIAVQDYIEEMLKELKYYAMLSISMQEKLELLTYTSYICSVHNMEIEISSKFSARLNIR